MEGSSVIILPDRNIPRAKFLMPVFDKEWRTPSLAQPKDQFGNENTTKFKVSAKSNDGVVIWTGWFNDRADFDAFLWAIAIGTLKQERTLWDLPTPNWQPYLGEIISYEFATTTFLTTPVNTNQSYTMPSDFNRDNNNIQAIGGGGSGGGAGSTSSSRASGGGGGAWNRTNNVPAVRNAVEYYRIGGGGASITIVSPTTGLFNGNPGGDTWFSINNAAPTSTSEGVLAKGGGGGNAASNALASGGAGGVGSSGIGTSSFNGGNGGDVNNNLAATGGGGAAGPNGAGASGVSTTSGSTGTAGGRGDNNTGGVGTAGAYTFAGNSVTTNAGNGSEIQASPAYGSGGGSGGSGGTQRGQSGNGGLYGGASGGARGSATDGVYVGSGRQGLLWITYEPLTRFGQPYNMPNLGL